MKSQFIVLALAIQSVGCSRSPQPAPQIIFAAKAYYDSGATAIGDGSVYVAGTLTGEGVGYPNNSTAITCYKDRMECLINSVEQIGPNQVSRLESPLPIQIVDWNPSEIVAIGEDLLKCRRETISILRKTEKVVWVQEAINQSAATCKDSDTRLYKWSIEESPGWKAISERK